MGNHVADEPVVTDVELEVEDQKTNKPLLAVAAATLVVGAVAFLVTRRRNKKASDDSELWEDVDEDSKDEV